MKSSSLVHILIGLLLFLDYAIAGQLYKVIITKVLLPAVNMNICKNVEVFARPQRGKPSQLNASCEFKVPVNTMHVACTLFYKFKTYRQFLVKERAELCGLVDGTERNLLYDLAVKIFKEKTNLIHRCPYIGREGLQNYTLSYKEIPPVLPAGKYRFDVHGTLGNNETIFFLQFFGELRPAGLTDISF